VKRDESKTRIGYEISFTKHFYKPVQLRELSEIIADIRALEAATERLLEEILGGGQQNQKYYRLQAHPLRLLSHSAER